MSDDEMLDGLTAYDKFGDAFDQKEDPLQQFDERFKSINQDPLEIYNETKLRSKDVTEKYCDSQVRYINRYKSFMDTVDRHPACPSIQHIGKYINFLANQDISTKYIISQLNTLSKMFDYWLDHPSMPHGTGSSEGFNPVDSALNLKEDGLIQRSTNTSKSVHQISVESLAHRLRQIKNVLHRAVITTQFKYGIRGGQVCRIKLKDVKLNHEGISELYPELGSHERIAKFEDDVIFFPHRDIRPGVKSARPSVVPIDAELKRILVQYLRQRPPVDSTWLFLKNSSASQFDTEYVNNTMWKPAFHPKYEETDQFRPITSHYARHRYTTYWRNEHDLKREYLKYLRGDKQGEFDGDQSDALDSYVHTYYSDISDLYLSKIYKFSI